MAIPFAFPTDEDPDANYQRLDQLLNDLYVVLQQILVTQRRIRDTQLSQITHRSRNGQPSNIRRTNESSDPVVASVSAPEPPSPPRMLDVNYSLPTTSTSTSSSMPDNTDLFRLPSIEEVATSNRSPSRRRRRRRRTSSESSCCDETKNNESVAASNATTPDWTQVGVNLRKIADDFYASVGKEDSQVPVANVSDEGKRPCDPADASLLSMLVPPPFGGSLWTAVIFVVGWRLLARAR